MGLCKWSRDQFNLWSVAFWHAHRDCKIKVADLEPSEASMMELPRENKEEKWRKIFHKKISVIDI